MKKYILAMLALCSIISAKAQEYVPTPENLAARQEFEESRLGIFIHWGIYSMMGDGEWVMNNQKIPYAEYKHLADGFYPSKFNADEWVKAFKAAGAKYITFTSRHHDGFSMFKTEASPYNIVDGSPFKRDIVGELAEACHKEGVKLHFYYSQLDWGRNDYYPLGNSGRTAGRPEGGDWNSYLKFMNQQLTELLTNYGPIGAIWYDGMWDKTAATREEWAKMWNIDEQYSLIHKLQPACLVGSNHHKAPFPGEDFQLFERDLPGENKAGFSAGSTVSESLPLETCQTLNGNWGYNVNDKGYMSSTQLIQYLVKTAGKGANLLINIGPRPDGTIPDEALERLAALGKWMDVNGGTIYGTKGGFIKEQQWGVTTQKDNKLYVHVLNHQDYIFIPVSGNKLVSATSYADGSKIAASQHGEGIIITVPKECDGCPDQIIQLNFKNNL